MKFYQNFNLKKYNSFRLDSIVKEIYFPESHKELEMVLTLLKNQKFSILGGGTNVILKPEIEKIICLTQMPKSLCIYNGATVVDTNISTTYFVNHLLKNNIIGIEGLIGIPGTLGGAIVMNAGSGYYTIADYLLAVTTINYEGKLKIYYKEDLNFGRRYSILQEKNEIVIEAIFDFKQGIPDPIEIERAKEHRKNLPKLPSAGGIWKEWYNLNPYKKQLIGLRIGDAEISNSINIIVNKGHASFNNIMNLIKKVHNIIGQSLELEVKII